MCVYSISVQIIINLSTDISPNISIIPVRNIYHPGDNVSCETDANPSPVYQWKNLQTGVVSYGPHVVLEVPKDPIPVYTYVCTVRYAVAKFNISRTFERTIIVTSEFFLLIQFRTYYVTQLCICCWLSR